MDLLGATDAQLAATYDDWSSHDEGSGSDLDASCVVHCLVDLGEASISLNVSPAEFPQPLRLDPGPASLWSDANLALHPRPPARLI